MRVGNITTALAGAGLLATLLAVLFVGENRGIAEDPRAEGISKVPKETGLLPFTVTEEQVPETVTAYGVVHAEAEAVLSAKLLARVLEMPKRAGDPVQKGDLLVALDRADLEAEQQVARASLARARAARTEAGAEFERISGLFKRGSATNRDMDRATARNSQAKSAVAEAEAHLALVKARLDHTRVTAPFAGRVVERLAEVGEMAAPGTPLVRIESSGAPELWVDLTQEHFARVAIGATATVQVDSLYEAYPATVVRAVPAADPRSHTFSVRVRLDAAGDGGPDPTRVRSGMFGRVTIPYGSRARITVPATAVLRRAEVTGVYVMDDEGGVSFRLVRTGRTVGGRVIIESGLAVGERIAGNAAAAARLRASGSAK